MSIRNTDRVLYNEIQNHFCKQAQILLDEFGYIVLAREQPAVVGQSIWGIVAGNDKRGQTFDHPLVVIGPSTIEEANEQYKYLLPPGVVFVPPFLNFKYFYRSKAE